MTEAIDIGSRLELFVDDHVVDRLSEADPDDAQARPAGRVADLRPAVGGQ